MISWEDRYKNYILIQMQEKYTKSIGSYKLTDRVLGQGSFSQVLLGYACRNKIAVKVIPRQYIQSQEMSSFQSQVEILKSLRNNHIVHLIDFKKTQNNFYLFLQYCEGGNLADYIKMNRTLSEKEALKLFKQIILGVSAMHQFKIIHRDLKPANILLKNGRIKIADFGLARKFSKNQMLRTYAGTPYNMAPQVLRRQFYNQKVDVYSAGTVLYEMLYGCSPFRGRDEISLLQSIEKGKYIGQNKEVSQRTQNLLKEMLTANAQDRIEIIDILGIINDYQCEIKQKMLQQYRRNSLSKLPFIGAPGSLSCAFDLNPQRYEARQMDQRLYHRLSRKLSTQLLVQ